MTMQRGSAKHSARADDELAKDLDAQLQRGGAQPEPWTEPEPVDPDDPDTPDTLAIRRAVDHNDLGPADTVRDMDPGDAPGR